MNVPHAADLLVTTYSPTRPGPVTYHPHARQTCYVAQGDKTDGDLRHRLHRAEPVLALPDRAWTCWSNETRGAVAVLGDSITDGITSSPGANRRWTDFLAERLRTEPATHRATASSTGASAATAS